ncbi:MAG: acyl-CoA thioesterase [Candidatus Lambdaproteobacteria bacterium]|nr:acyl-CoA thioesterase [Candidatus Lambdaproteobacteria bacterium]
MATQATRTVEDSADFLATIIGEESQRGQRVQAGPILRLMVCAAESVAQRHCGCQAVLLGLDRIDLTRVISHMDLVRFDARLVDVGHSSMVVEVRASVQRPMEREFSPSHVGFITMVAVDGAGRPLRELPKLNYDTPLGAEAQALVEHRRAQLAERKQALEWIAARESLRPEDVIEPFQIERYDYLTPQLTTVQVKRPASARRDDGNVRIRAGDLLMWADQVATYTAQRFANNDQAVTISVNDIVFKRPMHRDEHIELFAQVSYVRSHSLEVAVDIILHVPDGGTEFVASIDFLIFNYHRSGLKKKITTGLRFEPGDLAGMRRYLHARTRYNFWKSHPESHLTQSPD